MSLSCPRCRTLNPDVAHYCRQCGLRLEVAGGAVAGAGRIRHPNPLVSAEATAAVAGAAHLHYGRQPVGGGTPLLGTEPLELTVFNGGYDLANVVLRVRGDGEAGRSLFALMREIETLARGQAVRLEIPSYELPGPLHALHVELVSAEFGAQD